MYNTLSKYYDYVFPVGMEQLNMLQSFLPAGEAENILDLACGSGSYSIELVARGFKVYGLDYEAEMIELARAKASARGLAVDLRQGDMRDLAGLPDNFDAALCIGNSIVHLLTDDDLLQSLKETNRHLRQGGIYLIQTVNYDRILQYKITSLPEIKNQQQGLTFTRLYTFLKDGLIEFTTELKKDLPTGNETVHRGSVLLRPLTAGQLTDALGKAGFVTEQLYGGFNSVAHSLEAPATVVIARKTSQV